MIAFSLNQLQSRLNGLLEASSDVMITAVSTDSRQLAAGALFVALKGDNFDGHQYCATAKQQGAVALLVSRPVDCDLPQLIVADTRVALGELAAWVKAQSEVKTVAITGSCGKTTVKEMLASILALQGKTLYTAGNFNNDIGVPLTLLRLDTSYDYAVIELGANHIGEIAYTTQLVKPDVALVTNLTAAHLEGFGSLEGVAQAKGEIFAGLRDQGTAVINLDSCGDWQPLLQDKKCLTLGLNQGDIQADNLQLLDSGCYQFELTRGDERQLITLSLAGKHNVTNALLAAAAAISISDASLANIANGLSMVAPVKGRGAISFPRQGLRLIDDSYNASFSAMTAAIDLLDSFEGKKVIILADMAEMGEHSHQLHRELALYVQKSSIDTVLTYGSATRVISELNQGLHFSTQDALVEQVIKLMNNNNELSILVKGANGMKMSRVVEAIERAASC